MPSSHHPDPPRQARRFARRLATPVALLVVVSALIGSLAHAQEVDYAPGFVDRDGAPLEEVAFASGDVAYLRIEIHNRSSEPLQPDRFWVALPPVEGVRLIGNHSTGFSFPDRLLGPDGEERMVDHDAPQDSTHLHGLSEPLAPGENTALTVRLTVLSSANGLGEYASRIHLLDAEDRRIGTLVNEVTGGS
jgi:hypothetical protein